MQAVRLSAVRFVPMCVELKRRGIFVPGETAKLRPLSDKELLAGLNGMLDCVRA